MSFNDFRMGPVINFNLFNQAFDNNLVVFFLKGNDKYYNGNKHSKKKKNNRQCWVFTSQKLETFLFGTPCRKIVLFIEPWFTDFTWAVLIKVTLVTWSTQIEDVFTREWCWPIGIVSLSDWRKETVTFLSLILQCQVGCSKSRIHVQVKVRIHVHVHTVYDKVRIHTSTIGNSKI